MVKSCGYQIETVQEVVEQTFSALTLQVDSSSSYYSIGGCSFRKLCFRRNREQSFRPRKKPFSERANSQAATGPCSYYSSLT